MKEERHVFRCKNEYHWNLFGMTITLLLLFDKRKILWIVKKTYIIYEKINAYYVAHSIHQTLLSLSASIMT